VAEVRGWPDYELAQRIRVQVTPEGDGGGAPDDDEAGAQSP